MNPAKSPSPHSSPSSSLQDSPPLTINSTPSLDLPNFFLAIMNPNLAAELQAQGLEIGLHSKKPHNRIPNSWKCCV